MNSQTQSMAWDTEWNLKFLRHNKHNKKDLSVIVEVSFAQIKQFAHEVSNAGVKFSDGTNFHIFTCWQKVYKKNKQTSMQILKPW